MTAVDEIIGSAAKERIYEGLDAAHTPRLFVPEIYVEQGSRKLELLAAQALLSSQMFPETQYDVIWLGNRITRLLRADIQPSGRWDPSFGLVIEGSDDRFVPDIGLIEQWPGGFTHMGRIERALANGAGVFKPADLSWSYRHEPGE